MQIVEVKNNIAKIIYNPAENNLLPSDFVLIEDNSHGIIAQVINVETSENSDDNTAYVRLALFIDDNDNLSYYNGYIPSRNSKIIYINSEEIIELIKSQDKNITFGFLSNHPECKVETGKDFFDKKAYIISDKSDKTYNIVNHIIKELYKNNQKVILVDFNGQYNNIADSVTLKITSEIKLPLNADAIDTIIKYDINDCSPEDRTTVQSILLDIREYLASAEDKYVQFNLFKKVVDNEFLENPNSGLMLLRNKLWLYSQDSLFADNKDEFGIINKALNENNLIVVDASELSEKWYKFVINTISDLLTQKCYMFVSIDDIDTDKKSIEKMYNKKNIIPVLCSTYNCRYEPIIKAICLNKIMSKPAMYREEQEYYNSLLNNINNDEYILYGETTLYLPLLIGIDKISAPCEEKQIQTVFDSEEEIKETEIIQEEKSEIEEDLTDEDLDFLDEFETEQTNPEEQEYIEDNEENIEYITGTDNTEEEKDYNVFEPLEENQQDLMQAEEIKVEDDIEYLDNQENETVKTTEEKEDLEEIQEIEPIEENSPLDELEEIQTDVEEEIVSLDDLIDNVESKVSSENEQLKEDAEYKDEIEQDTEENGEFEEQEETTEEELSHEQYSENEQAAEETEEKEVLKEDTEEEITPPKIKEEINRNEPVNIKVYETDMAEAMDEKSLQFKIGDKVYHPKHGKGVVEGFANYSNKILFCQIEFENVGRRILDPRIAGIEKIS